MVAMVEAHDWAGLRASDIDSQERAALALYDSPRLEATLAGSEAATALHESVAGGNHSAAAILLLGHLPPATSGPLLKNLARGDERTKLRPWLRPVSIRLPSLVALSRQGDVGARRALLEHIEQAPIDDIVFLLAVAREFDDPVILQSMSRFLGDERPVAGGVPSGAAPQRRLADLTADTIIDRLQLPVSFARRPAGHYSPEELDEVRRRLGGAVPH